MADVKIKRLKRVVVKEEYVAITGDLIEAIILNQMIYWSERVADFKKFVDEERKRLNNENDDCIPLQYGWIHKAAGELKEEIMSNDSVKTILRRLDSLVSKGFLIRRSNPDFAYDRVYQYRVNFKAVLAALSHEGYCLEGYKVELCCNGVESVTADICKGCEKESECAQDKTVISEVQNDFPNGHNIRGLVTCDHRKCHGVSAIPETTPKITTETTSSPSYSPRQETRDGKTEDGTTGELDSFFDAMGIERLNRCELIGPMKAVIADLWRTRRVGKTTVSRETVKKAFSCLSPEIIEGIFDKFDRQEKKGQIVAPTEYIKALILNTPVAVELSSAARQQKVTGGENDGASYDIDEFVKLSMGMLHGE